MSMGFTNKKTKIHFINAPATMMPPLPVLENETRLYSERSQIARSICQKYNNIKEWDQYVPSGYFWSTGYPKGIHFCTVPKVGTTYWLRIIRFITKDYPQNENIAKPSQLSRRYVHYEPPTNTKLTALSNRKEINRLSEQTFMFSRDPYTRIWSAYIDKFLLPDFWRFPQAVNVATLVRPNATQEELACPKHITFHEYLVYVTHFPYADDHWKPAHRVCSPCHVHFDVIGHQATFSKDAKYILNKYGYRNLIEEIDSVTRVDGETYMILKYNFNLKEYITTKGCFDNLDVAKRLWKAFQYNGYIHKDTPFPQNMNMELFNQDPIHVFYEHVEDVINMQRKQGIRLKPQRRELMIKAYKEIPVEILQKLKEIYKHDFEMFGYEAEPKDIFSR